MNILKKFRDRSPEEMNRSYKNTILICTFMAVLLLFTILAISYPEDHGDNSPKGSGAESAAAEISAGLQVESEDSLSGALSYVETYYSSTPADKRSELVEKRFTKLFFSRLKSEAGVRPNAAEEVVEGEGDVRRIELRSDDSQSSKSDDDGSKLGRFEKYLESFAADELKASVLPSSKGLYIAYSKADNYVEIQNLTVRSGKDGSQLVTSIRFTPPKDAAGSDSGTYTGSVNSYAAAADGSIVSTGGSNHIEGSAYAGKSIEASTGGTLILDGPETVTRGSAEVSGSAMLKVNGGEVWADDVKTVSSAGSLVSSHSGNNIEANADFFVNGDLSLENTGYDVDINGSYYGYGTGDSYTEDSADGTESEDDASTASSSGSTSSPGSSSASAPSGLNSLTGSTGNALLQKLFNTNKVLTDRDSGGTRFYASSNSSGSKSTISVKAGAAQAHVAYMPGQILWLAEGSIYNIAGAEGRAPFTSTALPVSVSSSDDDSGASNLDMLYTYQFNGLTSGFDKNFSTSRPSYELVEHLLKNAGLKRSSVIYVSDGKGGFDEHPLEKLSSSDGGHISITPRSKYKSGIVVADCDVNMTNVNFTGMVITTGNINLTGGATITSSPALRFTALAGSGSNKNEEDGRVKVSLEKVTETSSEEK